MFGLFNKVPGISTTDLADKLKEKVLLLDVRTPEEYREGHIPTSKNVPLDKITGYNGEKVKTYVICRSGARSKQAASILQKKGYDVVNVEGGMNHWQGSIERGN